MSRIRKRNMSARDELKRLFKLEQERQRLAAAEAERKRAAEEQRRARERAEIIRRRDGPEAPEEMSPAETVIRANCDWEGGLWVPKYTSYSDYSGSFVERSNAEFWKEHYTFFKEKYGGHGTVWTGIDHADIPSISAEDLERLTGDFDSLEDYPVLDEGKMSEMETKAQDEYWESDGRKEVRAALIQKAGHNPTAALGAIYLPDEQLDHLYSECSLYDYVSMEEGGNVYMDAEKQAENIPLEVVIDYAEANMPGVERKAFFKNLPEFMDLAAEVLQDQPEIVQKLQNMSDDHLFNLFKRLEKAEDGESLWHMDDDQLPDPVDVFSFDTHALKSALLHLNDSFVQASKPEDPRQMRLPLPSEQEGLLLANLMLKS